MRVKRLKFIYVLLLNLILVTSLVHLASCEVIFAQYQVETKWPGGFEGSVTIPATEKFLYGWIFYILFDFSVENFKFHEGFVAGTNLDGRLYVVLPLNHNKFLDIVALGTRKMRFQAVIEENPPDAQVLFIALKDEYETVHEGLMRATGGVINATVLTLPKTTTTVATTTVPQYASKFATVSRPWWMETSTKATTSSRNLLPGAITPVTPPKPTPPNLASLNFVYNLREVITQSLKFFEAQRSGYLPSNEDRNKRISWRSHSAIRDGFDYGVDLVGGYYIDGGFVKYGYPMAFATTLLAWSFIEFETAYLASKQYHELINSVIWSADYFVKCHVSTYELFGQVSAGVIEDNYWSRPEDIGHTRPSFKITKSKPGSDLAAETSAALATAYLITKKAKPELASEYLRHAKQLYEFAERYHRKYHLSIPRARDYRSTGYYDELAWAAAWLYKATGKEKYLENAATRLALSNRNEEELKKFDWNDKRVGVNILLAQFTKKQEYLDTLTDFCLYMQPEGGASYTPKGLLYLDSDSPIMHSANVAFSCLLVGRLGVLSRSFQLFAHRQLSYILGDGGRSYVVGFGKNFPRRPQHRASSCPRPPAICDWTAAESDEPNPQILYGAVVAGPNSWDIFNDKDRMDKNNKVSILYNAGLQALAAGILQLQVAGETYSEPNMEELRSAITLHFSIRHDLNEVLRKSLLFYEAQRSGTLPHDNRIPWRSSAFENDVGESGEDLSGGYFDGGGYVKFNFPMAYTTTVLSWGVIEYGEAYQSAFELNNAIEAVKWATDYFIKCHVSDTQFEVYGQVGEAKVDNRNWTRPDELTHARRRAFKLDQNKPGSEVAAEMAAALASASLVFRKHRNSSYADTLVAHAIQLYKFAETYKEEYHRSIPDAAPYYRSASGYEDELVWAATWLFMATGEESYIKNIAEPLYDSYNLENRHASAGFYYDEKTPGVQLLLAQITGKEKYRYSLRQFCDQFMPGNGAKFTPLGLLYLSNRSPLKHAAGVAYICIGAAKLGIRPEKYRHFAQTQIRYILGDSGRGSYVVGYGPSPPKRPHHRLSSCPLAPDSCSFKDLKRASTNPNVLVGAVVAGPDDEDFFSDVRIETRFNRVALDHNACFQSAVAALRYLEIYPPPPTTTTAETTTIATTTQPTTTTSAASNMTTSLYIDEEILLELDNFDVIVNQTQNTTTPLQVTTINATTVKQDTTLAAHFSTTPFSTTSSFLTETTPQADNVTIDAATTIETSGDELITTTGIMNATSVGVTTTTWMKNITDTTTVTTPSVITLFPTIRYPSCNSKAVFDACSVTPEQFEHHPLRTRHSCRYMAFKECVSKLKARCKGNRVKWSNFAFWNNDQQSNAWFSQEDIDCVDEETRAINECLTRGMMATFDKCLKSKNSTSSSCKWKNYESCVESTVGHCVKTWSLWELWTLDQNRTIYFQEIKDEGCTSNAICSTVISFSTLFACFFLLFSYLV